MLRLIFILCFLSPFTSHGSLKQSIEGSFSEYNKSKSLVHFVKSNKEFMSDGDYQYFLNLAKKFKGKKPALQKISHMKYSLSGRGRQPVINFGLLDRNIIEIDGVKVTYRRDLRKLFGELKKALDQKNKKTLLDMLLPKSQAAEVHGGNVDQKALTALVAGFFANKGIKKKTCTAYEQAVKECQQKSKSAVAIVRKADSDKLSQKLTAVLCPRGYKAFFEACESVYENSGTKRKLIQPLKLLPANFYEEDEEEGVKKRNERRTRGRQ